MNQQDLMKFLNTTEQPHKTKNSYLLLMTSDAFEGLKDVKKDADGFIRSTKEKLENGFDLNKKVQEKQN